MKYCGHTLPAKRLEAPVIVDSVFHPPEYIVDFKPKVGVPVIPKNT